MESNELVREYWEKQPCGTDAGLIGGGNLELGSREWFSRIEEHRYAVEPFIHSLTQFTRHHGKRMLEVGVGAGTDHLQWARAGCECFGVDLTEAAVETTKRHLACHGLASRLLRVDAERLPFDEGCFDLVYAWGVIHHTEHPERIVEEIRRVLRKRGVFLGMMYRRHSVTALKVWILKALLKGKPWLSLREVIGNHVESPGTKAYTVGELAALFKGFSRFQPIPILTPYDTEGLPGLISQFLPPRVGWFIGIKAVK